MFFRRLHQSDMEGFISIAQKETFHICNLYIPLTLFLFWHTLN